MSKRIAVIMLLAIVVIGVIVNFDAAYVLSARGLVGVSTDVRSDVVVVSGSTFSSGAKITGVTLTRSDGDVLLRIYAEAIEPTDDPRRLKASFRVPVAVDDRTVSIAVGDSPGWLTIGRCFGVPVRVPRIRKESAMRVVWRRSRVGRSATIAGKTAIKGAAHTDGSAR